MTDLASLGLKVDSTQVKTGVAELDRLTAAGTRAEGSVDRLGDSAAQTGGQVKGASAQAAAFAANAQRMAATATAGGAGMARMGAGTGLAAHQVQNLTFQLNDMVVGLASGQRPLTVLFQQGAQVGQIMQQAGLGVSGFAAELARLTGIIKVTSDAEADANAAAALGARARIASAAQQATASIAAADTELALSVAAVRTATTTEALAVAQTRLAAAHEAVAVAAAQAAVAEDALAVASGRAAQASTAAAAATVTAFGPVLPILVAVGAAAAVLAGTFKLLQSDIRSSGALERYANSLGLTKKEMIELRQEVGGFTNDEMKDMENRLRAFEITWGDVWNGLAKSASDALDLSPAWQRFKSGVADAFGNALSSAVEFAARMYGYVVGSYHAIVDKFSALPAQFGHIFTQAANAGIAAIEKLINKAIDGLNTFAQFANRIPGFDLSPISHVNLGSVKDTYGEAGKVAGTSFSDKISEYTAKARKEIGSNVATIVGNIEGAAEARIKREAGSIIEGRSDKKGGGADRKKKEVDELAKAYERALAAARQFNLGLVEETQRIGKSAVEVKRLEVQKAALTAATYAAFAPTKAMAAILLAEADAMRKNLEEREKATKSQAVADFIKNVIEPLEFESELLGKSTAEQQILRAEREATAAGIDRGSEAWTRYIAAIQGAIDAEAAPQGPKHLLDMLEAIADQASVTAGIMSNAFGSVGDVIGNLIANIADYSAEKEKLTQEVAKDTIKQSAMDKQLATLNAKNTAQAISGVKSLFKEKSTAYKIMSAIEKAYAVFQLATSIASIAQGKVEVANEVGDAAAKAAANQAAGASKIFSQLGVYAFPVVAAMIALLASLGVGGGGGGKSAPKIPTADELQEQAGTGTVLGDSKAKSESIANSLEIVAANTNRDLEYSNAMLKALRSIDFGIARLAGTVAQQIQVSGSLFDTSSLKLGSSGSSGFLGLFASSTTKTLWDLGINLMTSTVEDIIAQGIAGQTYQTVQKVKKSSGFLGIGGGTKTTYSTTTGNIDQDITNAIGDVVRSLRDGLVAGADVIGLQGAEAILNSFQVSIGQISFKDMTGEEIEDQLNAIFSKVGDQMAGAIFPALTELQMVGEGLFETFMRVAREYQVVDVALRSIGKEFGAVGIASLAARDNLVQLFGSLDDFAEATEFFRDQFLSPAEQIVPVMSAVTAEMARLGLAGVTTRDQFKAAVLGLDLTTAAGREMYASLLSVAPAFDKVIDYFDDANKKTADGLKSTADRFNGFAESLKKYRDTLFLTDAAQGNAYNILRTRFLDTAALAAQGDATALGGLEGSGKAFLETSRRNASTLLQYQRDVAIVVQGVDKGIFAAESVADYAQLQYDALTNAVSILGVISTNTAATAAAMAPLQQPATASQPAGLAPAATTAAPSSDAVVAELRALRQEQQTANLRLVETTSRMELLWQRFEGDGLRVKTDEDTPLQVEVI